LGNPSLHVGKWLVLQDSLGQVIISSFLARLIMLQVARYLPREPLPTNPLPLTANRRATIN
jgi:hypothetical protein